MGAGGGGAAFLHVLSITVAPDPVVQLLTVGLLASPQHCERPPRLLHHVHDAVQQLRGDKWQGWGGTTFLVLGVDLGGVSVWEQRMLGRKDVGGTWWAHRAN